MVEKPEEGICFHCGSEDLVFKDDGTGRCKDCHRVFNWDTLPSIGEFEEERGDRYAEQLSENHWKEFEDFQDDIPDTRDTRPPSKKIDFNPSRTPAAASRKKPKKGFLWIGITGIITMIIGYSMFFLIMANTASGGGVAENTPALSYIAIMLNCIGILLLGMGMFYGAAGAEHLDDRIRAWMFIAMAIILGLFITFGTSFMLATI